jgi:hypothetical protein
MIMQDLAFMIPAFGMFLPFLTNNIYLSWIYPSYGLYTRISSKFGVKYAF